MEELLPGSGKDPIAPGCSRQIKDWKALVITLQYKNRPGFIPRPDLPLLPLPAPLLPPTQGRADATHPVSTAGRHNTAAGLVLAFLGGGGKKRWRGGLGWGGDSSTAMASGWHVQTVRIRRLGEEPGHAQRRPHILRGFVPGREEPGGISRADVWSGEDHVCGTI